MLLRGTAGEYFGWEELGKQSQGQRNTKHYINDNESDDNRGQVAFY